MQCACAPAAGKERGAGEGGRAGRGYPGEERTCGAANWGRLHLNALRAPILSDVVLHLPGQRAQVRHLDRGHRFRLAAAREPRGAKVVALEEERQGRAPCDSPLVGGEADLVGTEEGEGAAHLVAAAQQRRHGCFSEQRRCDFDLGARRLQWHRGAAVKGLIGAEAQRRGGVEAPAIAARSWAHPGHPRSHRRRRVRAPRSPPLRPPARPASPIRTAHTPSREA